MDNRFAVQLKRLRKQKGYTQQEVATELSIGQTSVANYENGTRIPDLSMCIRIADFYGVSLDQLVGRESPQTPAKEQPAPPRHTAKEYFTALYHGRKNKAQQIMRDCLRAGVPSDTIYTELMEKALHYTGILWANGELPVWKEHLISETVLENLSMIQRNRKKKKIPQPKRILSILPGTEQHGIGLKILGALLEEHGHDPMYLGNHVPADHVLEAIETLSADAILFSVTMAENVDTLAMLIEKIRRHFGTRAPLLLIGGTAIDKLADPCAELNADACCMDYREILSLLESSGK